MFVSVITVLVLVVEGGIQDAVRHACLAVSISQGARVGSVSGGSCCQRKSCAQIPRAGGDDLCQISRSPENHQPQWTELARGLQVVSSAAGLCHGTLRLSLRARGKRRSYRAPEPLHFKEMPSCSQQAISKRGERQGPLQAAQ